MIHIYGIPNCDSVKKAIQWIKANKLDFTFHDFRIEEITSSKLKKWTNKVGWDVLLNKKSTTWRGLSVEEQSVSNNTQAIKLMVKYLTLIKRPVIEFNDSLLVGFNEEAYSQHLKR